MRDEEKIISSKIIESNENNYHSAYLISTIRDVLKDNSYSPKDIDAIGINVGPGSFTGIRACTTVARVMAQQLDCKAVGVSSLEILSRAEKDEFVVALDARKNKAYYFDKRTNTEPKAVELEEVDKLVKGKRVITDDRLIERFRPLASEVVSYQQMNYELGVLLSELVVEKLRVEDCNWGKVLPLYIQPPPVNV